MCFLKLTPCHVLAGLCSWSLCFLCLSSCGAQPTQPPWLARSPSPGRVLRPCLPCCDSKCRIWARTAETRPQLSQCILGHTCSLISAFLEERLKKKQNCLLPNRWHPKIPTKRGEMHFPAVFPSSQIYISSSEPFTHNV